jgi:predicted metal-binding membrane protein
MTTVAPAAVASPSSPAPRAWPRLPIVAAIGGAWVLAVAAEATGRGAALHHDSLIEGGLPMAAALGLFVVAWQAMIAAMMLPSSLPLIRLFGQTTVAVPERGRTMAAFLGGYAVVWSGFGVIAFLGDTALHRTVDSSPWLSAHPWVIGGSVFILAGAFQFSSLKERCLTQCRHPAAWMLKHYRRGTSEAFRMGRSHGLFCLGCCWALMLVSFAAGVANLAWMGVLTLIMVFEKTARHGQRAVAPIGVGLLVVGALVLAHPGWLPSVLSSSA